MLILERGWNEMSVHGIRRVVFKLRGLLCDIFRSRVISGVACSLSLEFERWFIIIWVRESQMPRGIIEVFFIRFLIYAFD
jgi:hypothetical protein